MPYNGRAVAWSDQNFDHTFTATWWHTNLPTLIISGSDDRIVNQHLWDDDRYRGQHVTHTIIDGGAHFAWIESPAAVKRALQRFAEKVGAAADLSS